MREVPSNILDYDRHSLEAWFEAYGEPAFRARQVMKWLYYYGETDLAAMTDLGKILRSKLAGLLIFKAPHIISESKSTDGTLKWLLQTESKGAIETVFIPEKNRGTLCISSQVGCALDCQFCATAKQGFSHNLSAAEILGQVWVANQALGGIDKRRISNVVFMGMGEPLLNFVNVVKAISVLTDSLGFGIAKRKVTVSTAGIIPGIDKLGKLANGVSLAISLHASTDVLRDKLVPINRHYKISDLLAACQRYTLTNLGTKITIEYVMLKGVNDRDEDAYRLAELFKGLSVKVNLIPFNHFSGTNYKCSDRIDSFSHILMEQGLLSLIRKTRGDDIEAACGQLVGRVYPRQRIQPEEEKVSA